MPRDPDSCAGVATGTTIAGAPLHVSGSFFAVAIVIGFMSGRSVAGTRLVNLPRVDTLDEALHAFDPGGALSMMVRPSLGWAVAAGVGVAIVYVLSVLAHELGHLGAARLVGVDVAAIQLHAAGGHVEMDDDDTLTAGRLAAIAGAGPLVTAVLALLAFVALTGLGWPLTGVPLEDASAGAALGRILSAAFTLNAVGLVVNLLPVRPLDGRHLLEAARLGRGRRGR